MGTPIWQMSAVETAAAIRDKRVSCVEVIDAHIERMAAVNPAINAVTVDLGAAARDEAERADAVIAGGGETGPLHGVPVTIKENVDQKGEATTNGVVGFADVIANEDSPPVANLRNAGAIVIGRTNTPEFSLRWFTDNKLRGLTKNPWDASRTCGGSSGGAVASVAMGIGTIAHGNDLGGSLRYPAYCCGLATIRPSLGRVPAYNGSGAERPAAIAQMSVQGPIAREVGDVRLALAAMSVRDTRDPLWKPVPLESDAPQTPVRVAVCDNPAGDGVTPSVAAAIATAADMLADAGYQVEKIDPPLVAEIAATWNQILNTEVSLLMDPAIQQHGSDDVRRVLGFYRQYSGLLDLEGYARALADRMRLRREWLSFLAEYPLVLAPVSQEPPFPVNDDLGGFDRVSEILDAQKMLVAINLLSLPSAAIPTGVSDGCPIGVQIVGAPYSETMCLDAAQAIEKNVGVLSKQLWESDA